MKNQVSGQIQHPCAYCGEEIPHYRSNKKYCDEDCKSKHFNQLQKEANLEMGRVNRILKKNFQIMKDLLDEEKNVKVKKIKMEKKGFNFRFHTSVISFSGLTYHNVYLLSWRDIEGEQVIISRAPETILEDR
ncbi:MAG: hypothetical protein IM537_16275 [Pseudanabaena sp. M57BS1SP1A06MG]|nr:hypothetical protein [Chitinophagaceae bacterium]MCA6460362.1 hypothetical protein [Chitinophagaceae bacterium]MCA6465249.1 hypothetical protein [Chitinophagaceae bacterium]MCA6601712.1 hypothetical protein [Pseudanabaena sp. M57BS1SP1A06MG]